MRLWLKKPLQVLAKVRLPGWRRVRLGSVAAIFWESITHPSFTLRAGAMAFSFFFRSFSRFDFHDDYFLLSAL